MVRFKTWRDSYLFLKEYGNFTCLNCKYSTHNLDTSINHTDMDYASLFCTKTISMVRLDLQFCCDKWEHEQTGDKLKDMDMDCMVWKVPYELLDVFDDKSKEWTIEEINEVCDEFTKSESEEDNC